MNQEIIKPGWRSHVSKVVLTLLVVALFNACSDEKVTLDENSPANLSNHELVSIAEVFAKAMQDPSARKLVKEEALLQFDGDYDILVQMILDKKVSSDKTFIQLLEDLSGNDIDQSLAKYPLLTIFIPTLKTFSAESWDIENGGIPKVAIDMLRDKANMIPLINFDGDISSISVKDLPTYPIIVLKENERVGIKGKSKLNSAGRSIVYGNKDFTYFFLDEQMGYSSARAWPMNGMDAKVKAAYTKSKNCGNCYHRDYIYYDISPTEGITTGPFDPHYSEAITSMWFVNNPAAQAASDSWTEGNLELHFVFLLGATTGITQVEKIHSTPLTSFQNGSDWTGGYQPAVPIPVAPWRMDLYGDRWKITVFEYDPAGSTVITTSLSTTIGSNFTIALAKIGINLGSSSTQTIANTTTITTTTGSDQLGEAILSWTDPVITSTVKLLGSDVAITNNLNTGSIVFSVEPIRTF